MPRNYCNKCGKPLAGIPSKDGVCHRCFSGTQENIERSKAWKWFLKGFKTAKGTDKRSLNDAKLFFKEEWEKNDCK